MIITYLYYIISIIGVILFVLSIQFKEKKDILLVQIGASFAYMLSYLLLKAYSGFYIELVEQIKDYFFYNYEKRKQKIPIILLIIFISLLIIISIFTYDGFLSLLPLFINIVYFISTYFKNPKSIRISILLMAFVWIIYNYYVGAYVIIIGNIIEIISALVSLKRFKNVNK